MALCHGRHLWRLGLFVVSLTRPTLMVLYAPAWLMWLWHVPRPCDNELQTWLGTYLCGLSIYLWKPLVFQAESTLKTLVECVKPLMALAWLMHGQKLLKSNTCGETSPWFVVFLRWFSVSALLLHGLHCALLCANLIAAWVLALLAHHGWLPSLVCERHAENAGGAYSPGSDMREGR